MVSPPQIRFRGLRSGGALEGEIRSRLARLERYYPGILSSRVLVRRSDRHHQAGSRFEVQLDLALPRRHHLLVSHVASPQASARDREQAAFHKADEVDREHRFAIVAIRDAFEVARRRLQDLARTSRGDVKRHTVVPRGRSVRLDGKIA